MNQKKNSKFLSPYRQDLIAELVDIIYEDYSVEYNIDPLMILSDNNISISHGHYKDAFDGLLELKKRKFHIYCNIDRLEGPNTPRTKFTIAHELGHYFIPEHREALLSGLVQEHCSFTNFQSLNPVEKEADYFASLLLLPADKIKNVIRKKKPGFEAIKAIADIFGTSWSSSAARYVSITTTPCILIKWSHEGYCWKQISPSFYEKGFRKTIESLDDIKKGSATLKALEGIPAEEGFHWNGTVASEWFPFIKRGFFNDNIIEEQAISLGRFGALTLIIDNN